MTAGCRFETSRERGLEITTPYSISRSTTAMKEPNSVILVPELALEVLEYCDIPEVAALSTMGRYTKGLVEKHMTARIRYLLRLLFPDDGEHLDWN